MKLLLTGRTHTWSVGGSLERYLRGRGVDLTVVREEEFIEYPGATLAARCKARATRGFTAHMLNESLLSAARESNPRAVLVVKGDFLQKRTLRKLGDAAKTVLISLDDFFPVKDNACSRRVRDAAPEYSLVYTTKRHNVAELQEHGVRNVRHILPAYDPAVHRRCWADGFRWDRDSIFIGSFEPERAEILGAVAGRFRVDVFGDRWPSGGKICAGPASYGEVRVDLIRRSMTAASFLRKNSRDEITDRPFELAGSGIPMLLEESELQRAVFGDAALYFSGADDFIMHLARLREDPSELAERSFTALQLVLGGHTYAHRFNEVAEALGL